METGVLTKSGKILKNSQNQIKKEEDRENCGGKASHKSQSPHTTERGQWIKAELTSGWQNQSSETQYYIVWGLERLEDKLPGRNQNSECPDPKLWMSGGRDNREKEAGSRQSLKLTH